MISGPIIPNTLNNLRDLLVDRVDLIEHGLRVVTEDLVLGTEAAVDVLACDATGIPMLVFLAVPETAAQLPSRVLGAQSWLRQNAAFLGQELSDPQLRTDLAPRFLVVGLDIFAETLEELRRTKLEGLTVAQLCSFTLGGRLRMGLTSLFESDPTPVAAMRNAFTVPPGIVDPGQRALAARFLDLAKRVDIGMSASGDRFSKRLFLHGRDIARLGLAAGKLHVEFPALAEGFEEEWVELTDDSCRGAVDRILRLVLAIELAIADPATDVTQEADEDAGHPSEQFDIGSFDPEDLGHAPQSHPVANPDPTESPAAPDSEDRFSLEPIRRSVAKAQLSREEFSALGEEGSDS